MNPVILVLEKYGKRKITTKDRLVIIDDENLSYYPLPDSSAYKETKRILLERQKKLRTIKGGGSIDTLDTNTTNSILQYKKDTQPKGIIPLSKLIIDDSPDNENKHIVVKNNEEGQNNIAWEFYVEKSEVKVLKDIVEEKKNKKANPDNTIRNSNRANEENQTSKQTSQSNQFEDYKFLQNIETIYQLLWTDYYKELKDFSSQPNKKSSKLIELELSIEIVQNYFSKYCERLAKLIISYLKQETFKERNVLKIIPILYPDLLECDEQNHFLIYYFFGVTITMTWNLIGYKKVKPGEQNQNVNQIPLSNRKDSRRPDQDPETQGTKILYGTWGDLKSSYKQSEYTHNNILYNNFVSDKQKLQKVPLTCLIDYCGFRFLCEYDISDDPQNPNDNMKKDSRRVEPANYKKCLELFYDLFSMQDGKKGQTDNNYSKPNINDNNTSKNAVSQEKAPYEKLFDIASDYFNNPEANKENSLEPTTSGAQNKKIYFKDQFDQANANNANNMSNAKLIEYLNLNEYDNLLEYPDQNLVQENEVLFKKKNHFRPELLYILNKKENFNEPAYKTKSDEMNKKENVSENNKSNHYQSQKKVERVYKEKYLNIFINSLDSFYYKVYNSEQITNLFHANGINLFSLGQIAEKAESPYLKEFCINEMLARTCKKIIFHLLAEERMHSFISYIEPLTSVSILQNSTQFKPHLLPFKYQRMYSNPEWTYFKHLKEIYLSTLSYGSDQYKFFYNIWITHPSTPKTNAESVKNEILNISATDNKKGNKQVEVTEHNKDKKAPTINSFDHIKRSKEIIAQFLNILFGKTKEKIKIKGRMRNHKELWNFLNEEIRNYYKIESKEMLVFCKLKCLSIPPFLSALEYHTGIELDWKSVVDDTTQREPSTLRDMSNLNLSSSSSQIFRDKEHPNQNFLNSFYPSNTNCNYTNRHILNIVWKPDDILEIQPKTKTFQFFKFFSNVGKLEEFQCNYSQLIINRNTSSIDQFDKYMLLRYYYDKIKQNNKFSLWYVIFFNELKVEELLKAKDTKDNQLLAQQDKNMQTENDSNKEGKNNPSSSLNKKNECIELYQSIYKELKSTLTSDIGGLLYLNKSSISNNSENTGTESEQLSQRQKKKFERLAYIMINIVKEIQNYDIANLSGIDLHIYKTNYASENTNHKKFFLHYETQAVELIANYYIQTHPYFSDIKELCGKEFLKKWKYDNPKNKDLENLIENYFKDAIENGLKCLSRSNIYLANLSLDSGTFYAFRDDYLNAVKIFNWAYLPFKQNSQDFQKDYYMYLKRFIKYNIKLGDYKTALLLGDELLSENALFRNEKDSKTTEYLNKYLHLERIIYNLASIALKTKEYDRGIKYCQNIFMDKGYTAQTNQVATLTSENALSENGIKKKKKTEYISWIKGREGSYPCKGMENDKDYEIKLKDAEFILKLKLYLKMIIRSLNEDQKVFYLQALLKIYDSAEEKKEIKRIGTPSIDMVRNQLDGKGDLNEYFKGKIILALKTKNKEDDNSNEKLLNKEKEQNSDYETFRILYCYFKNDNVFYSFLDKVKTKK